MRRGAVRFGGGYEILKQVDVAMLTGNTGHARCLLKGSQGTSRVSPPAPPHLLLVPPLDF